MPQNDTPPSSPAYELEDQIDEEEVLFEVNEDELEEILDAHDAAAGDSDDSNENDQLGLDAVPERDDAVRIFEKHKESVFVCHVEPNDGKFAVTGGQDDVAFVWDVETGEVLLECTGHQDSVTAVEFSHDGSFVATADMAGQVQVWRTNSMEKVWDYAMGDMSWMKWHHGTNVLLAGAVSSEVYMWKVPRGDCKVIGGNGVRSDCAVILPDGKRACVGHADGSLKIIDLKAGTILKSMSGAESGTVSDLAASHDNNLVLAGINGKAVLASTTSGKVLSTLSNHVPGGEEEQSVETVCFSPDPALPLAAFGTLEGYIFIWDLGHQTHRHIIRQGGAVTKLLWDPDKSSIYTAGTDGVVRLYDVRSGLLEREWQGHRGDVLDISFSRKTSRILTASDDSTARIFDVRLG